MTRTRTVALTTVCLLAAAGAASEAPLKSKPAEATSNVKPAPTVCPACAMGMTAEKVFARLDVDGDKTVTVKEFMRSPGMSDQAEARAAVGRIDTDGDGALSWAELAKAYKERHAKCPKVDPSNAGVEGRGNRSRFAMVFMMRNDKNGDGAVDKSEFRGSDARFDQMDKNANGKLESEELADLHASRMNDPMSMRERLASGDLPRRPPSKSPSEAGGPKGTSKPQAKGRKCPADKVVIGGQEIAKILTMLGAKREVGASDEQLQSYARHFDRTDPNHDGQHTRVEYVVRGGYMTPQARSGIFGAADNNADGVVTRTEYVLNRIITDEAKGIVQPTDADKDGKITKDEFVDGINLKDRALAAAIFDGLDTSGDGAIAIPEYLRVWGGWARPNYRTQEASVAKRLEAVLVRPAKATLFNMEAICDASTFEIEVIQEWHRVEGEVPTRQKLVTINVGEIWPGQSYRMPVRMVVPVDRKAKGFHLTGGNTPERLKRDTRLSALDRELIEGGVGLVYTVVQVLQQSGLEELGRASEERFIRTLNPRDKIQYWAWPATMMRAITTAYAEGDHFEEGKVAMSGGSKNGATPSLAIIHDERMTAVHASVSPIWDSPLRLCDRKAWDEVEAVSGLLNHRFLGGHFGPVFNREALAAGHTWEDLESFAAGISDSVFITRNIDALRARGVDMLFHPGTHDFVAFDIAWGGAHHPDIPLYLGANTGHGKKRAHPRIEHDQQNKVAFLLRHFFPDEVEPLLPAPAINYEIREGVLNVRVTFPPGVGDESGRIWWIYDRPVDGSPGYRNKMISDDHCAEMKYDEATKSWTAAIILDSDTSRIDFFSNHRKTINYCEKRYSTYISSPYTRTPIRVGE